MSLLKPHNSVYNISGAKRIPNGLLFTLKWSLLHRVETVMLLGANSEDSSVHQPTSDITGKLGFPTVFQY